MKVLPAQRNEIPFAVPCLCGAALAATLGYRKGWCESHLIEGRPAQIAVSIAGGAGKVVRPDARTAEGRLHASDVVGHQAVHFAKQGRQVRPAAPHLYGGSLAVRAALIRLIVECFCEASPTRGSKVPR
jgi:hypothetical protein